MNERGFTIAELLVSITLGGLAMGVLYSAVSNQSHLTRYQVGSADVAENVRGALEMVERELRMAGYGMEGVPAAALAAVQLLDDPSADLAIEVRANFGNVKGTGSASANSTLIDIEQKNPFPAFVSGQRVAIESGLRGLAEVRTIAAVDSEAGTLTVDAPLTIAYEPGSPVNQIEAVRYRLVDGILFRNQDPAAEQINAMALNYLDGAGTDLPDPASDDLRGVRIDLQAQRPADVNGLAPQARFSTETFLRNLCIQARLRDPAECP